VVTSSDQIVVQNLFLLDGYPYTPEFDPIVYQGYCAPGFDVVLDPEQEDHELDLSGYGTIKRIHMQVRSGTISYKLNDIAEPQDINFVSILTQHPTSLKFSNAHEEAMGIIEVFIIGETT
jgi:hypothetical protein